MPSISEPAALVTVSETGAVIKEQNALQQSFARLSARAGVVAARLFSSDLVKARAELRLAEDLHAEWQKDYRYLEDGHHGGRLIEDIERHARAASGYYCRVLGIDEQKFLGSQNDVRAPLELKPDPALRDRPEELAAILLELGKTSKLFPLHRFRASVAARVFHTYANMLDQDRRESFVNICLDGFRSEGLRAQSLVSQSSWYGERNMRSSHSGYLFAMASTFTEDSAIKLELVLNQVESYRMNGGVDRILRSLRELIRLVGDETGRHHDLFKRCGDKIVEEAWRWEYGKETLDAVGKFAYAFWAYEWAGEAGVAPARELRVALQEYLKPEWRRNDWLETFKTDAEGYLFLTAFASSLGRLPVPPGRDMAGQRQVMPAILADVLGGQPLSLAAGPASILRKTTLEDVQALSRVHSLATFELGTSSLPEGLDVRPGENTEHWRSVLADPASRVIVSEREGEVRGFVWFGASPDEDLDSLKCAEIYDLYVLPEAQRQGHGRVLCVEAFAELQASGFEEVTAWVIKDNDKSRLMLEKLGFEPDGQTKVDDCMVIRSGSGEEFLREFEMLRLRRKLVL